MIVIIIGLQESCVPMRFSGVLVFTPCMTIFHDYVINVAVNPTSTHIHALPCLSCHSVGIYHYYGTSWGCMQLSNPIVWPFGKHIICRPHGQIFTIIGGLSVARCVRGFSTGFPF